MKESQSVFGELVTMFRTTPVVLIFTCCDLLEEKMAHHPIKQHFPDFMGSTTEDAKMFFKDLFLSVVDMRPDRILVKFSDLIHDGDIAGEILNYFGYQNPQQLQVSTVNASGIPFNNGPTTPTSAGAPQTL